MGLQQVLYKEILQKKSELEDVRKKGINVRVERDLPTMAVGCEYSGVERCGFSSHSKHLKRPDIIKPFDIMLEQALMAQAPGIPKLPYVVFSKKRQSYYDAWTGTVKYRRVVEKFVGTCAEDNAANSVLYTLGAGQKPASLKDLSFIPPVRTRTLKRERMCGVCRTIFTEP